MNLLAVDSIVLWGLTIPLKLTLGELLSTIIIFVTLLVLIVYTVSTIGLWKQAQLQTELSISPFLIFDIESNKIFIKNLGNSPALKLEMDNLYLYWEDMNDPSKKNLFEVVFEEIDLVDSRTRALLEHKVLRDRADTVWDPVNTMDPKYQTEHSFELILKYTNLIGKRYYTKIQTGKGGIKVLAIGRMRAYHRILFRLKKRRELQFLRAKGYS
jgi:hypothetical protein